MSGPTNALVKGLINVSSAGGEIVKGIVNTSSISNGLANSVSQNDFVEKLREMILNPDDSVACTSRLKQIVRTKRTAQHHLADWKRARGWEKDAEKHYQQYVKATAALDSLEAQMEVKCQAMWAHWTRIQDLRYKEKLTKELKSQS